MTVPLEAWLAGRFAAEIDREYGVHSSRPGSLFLAIGR
jgi:hypothetical protein